MKLFYAFILSLAFGLPCSAEVGIYLGKPSITRLGTGFYYRSSSENYVSARRGIRIPGLFQYIVFDSETGDYTVFAASGYPHGFTSYDFTQYPLDAFVPSRPYYYTSEVEVTPDVMIDERGRGALSFRDYGVRSGDLDSNGSNETAVVGLGFATGKIRPFRLRTPSRNLVTMTRTPLLLKFEGGGTRYQSLAVKIDYDQVLWEPGATYSSHFSKTRYRFDRKNSAYANDPAGPLIDGYAPGTYEYGVAMMTQAFDEAGYLTHSIDPDADFTVYFNRR